MTQLAKTLTGLAALAFALAVVSNYIGLLPVITTSAEGYSHASTNLALIAIAIVLCFGNGRR